MLLFCALKEYTNLVSFHEARSIVNKTNINNGPPNKQLNSNGTPIQEGTETRNLSNEEKIIHKSFFTEHKPTIIVCSLVGIMGILSAYIMAFLHYR